MMEFSRAWDWAVQHPDIMTWIALIISIAALLRPLPKR